MAEAARNIAYSFSQSGAGITTEISPNIETTKSLGPAFEFCQRQAGVNIPYNVKIIHITPDMVLKHMEIMKYHIFHLFWETDKLPDWWVWSLNHSVDEVWTGSEWNRKVFQQSGVKVPIWVCPQPVDKFPFGILPFEKEDRPEFLFGSIFQWIERKDPHTLITSFLEEFKGNANVGLLIKSYKERFTDAETQEIVAQIKKWKHEIGAGIYPKIYFYPHALGKHDMQRFFKTIDCFVSTHRGEGWGLPIVEAMGAGLPTISTNLGGCHEHIPLDLWYPIEYTMCNVFNMSFIPWYDETQQWGQALKASVRSHMRNVYDHQTEAKERGRLAKRFVDDYFSYTRVGHQMIKHIEETT